MEKRSFKKYFDKIYCINYVEAKSRRDSITKQFSDLDLLDGLEFSYGMPFKKINAIRPHFEELSKSVWYFSKVESIACALNHYSAIKTAYELGANSVLILEDDIILRNDRELILDYLDNIPEDWNYLYFTPTFPALPYNMEAIIHDLNIIGSSKDKWVNLNKLQLGQKHILENGELVGFFTSGCYALDRKGMELYIKIFETSNSIASSDMIEYFYHNISQNGLNCYTTNTRLFAVNDEIDSIGIDTENNKYIIHPSRTSGSISSSIDCNSKNFNKNLEDKSIIHS